MVRYQKIEKRSDEESTFLVALQRKFFTLSVVKGAGNVDS